ncbi:MAG: HD-like signal output (HDOD) protein [Planctomycetota bacterium]
MDWPVIVDANPIIDRLKTGEFEVPLLPEAATQVMSICSNADCDLKDLIETIKKDQSLMAHVLRMANSALYSGDIEIVSLQLAVSRLGLSTVRDLAAAAACKGAVFKPGKSRELVQGMFQQAMARGIFAQEIARVRRSNVEIAFLSGLMREIGSPIIVFELEKADIDGKDATEIINDFRFRVGEIVLNSWDLPEKICQSVKFAGRPEEAGDIEDVVQTVELAQLLSSELLDPSLGRDSVRFNAACGALNLYEEDIHKLTAKAEKVREMVESIR